MTTASINAAAQDHGVAPRDVVRGLDTLRFVTAMWVAFAHGARFPIDQVLQPTGVINKMLYALVNTTFNGTAAVAVFFVISGLLIHGANVGKSRVELIPFWTRRAVRIGIPLAVVLILAQLLGGDYGERVSHVLWSVYAELIYYGLYPLVLPIIFRFGIGRVLLVSLAISLGMLLLIKPDALYLWEFGHSLNWLFCAPLWLMGCYLAENRQRITAMSQRVPIWGLRIGAVAYCYISTVMMAHMGHFSIGYTWTIWVFGLFCMVWLAAEIARGTGKVTIGWMERFGIAGYSIYLTHPLAVNAVKMNLPSLSPFTHWLAVLAAIAIVTAVFYHAVEWPAHQLARRLGRRRPAVKPA